MFVIGWLLGGPGRGERKAMALVTAVRNTGVGLVIVAGNFANTAAVPSVTVFRFGDDYRGYSLFLPNAQAMSEWGARS